MSSTGSLAKNVFFLKQFSVVSSQFSVCGTRFAELSCGGAWSGVMTLL